MIKVVITGAAGFVGRALSARLAARGVTIVPVSRRALPGLHHVTDYRATPPGDVVVHLAEEPDRAKVNEQGEAYRRQAGEVLEALVQRFRGQVIYGSSATVYGDTNPRPNPVDAPVHITDSYSEVKLRNERIVLDGGGAVARLTNLFGRGMAANNVVADIVRQVPGTAAVVVRDDTPVRDFLDVADAASALALMVERRCREIVNVGSGTGRTIRELGEMILAVAGERGRAIVASRPAAKASINILDISRTRALLDWAPSAELAGQLKALVCRTGILS